MRKKRLLLLANNHEKDTPFAQWIDPCAVELAVVTSTAYQESYSNYPQVFTWNHSSSPESTNILSSFAIDFKPDIIFTRNELELEIAAELRDQLNLPGMKTVDCLPFRNKYLMKQQLAAGGLKVPPFNLCHDQKSLLKCLQDCDRNVIKPLNESGSSGVMLVGPGLESLDMDELCWPVLVEDYVEGDLYHVDGYCEENTVMFSITSKYLDHCLSHKEGGVIGTCVIPKGSSMDQRMKEACVQVLVAMPSFRGSFHCEIFHNNQDQLVVCEVAARTPGGRIKGQIKQATGYDLDEAFFSNTLAPGSFLFNDKDYKLSGSLYFFEKQNKTLLSHPNNCPFDFVEEYNDKSVVGKTYGQPEKSGKGLMTLVLSQTDCQSLLHSRVNTLLDWFNTSWKWSH